MSQHTRLTDTLSGKQPMFDTDANSSNAAHANSAPSENRSKPVKQALLSTYVTNVDDHFSTVPVPVRRNASVTLTKLPESTYGISTIAVAAGEQIIGYLPTSHSRLVIPLIDAGLMPIARVCEVRTFPRPAVRIEIELSTPAMG